MYVESIADITQKKESKMGSCNKCIILKYDYLLSHYATIVVFIVVY